ncbi:hypothetical protein FZC78_08920 [Rossellomorea vietnamensis]|uniref:Uncharacterized protein n=1 Tax=Rossellomorea vietnamensis TaxID=218284 RepID=A0A5D4NVI5_9BACI|nr:hypothetical protein [Rossellomorea vietnamensis]TYS17950.1 hypothetical protein FZC78_08920 [Rossellomorea vietnamensis]
MHILTLVEHVIKGILVSQGTGFQENKTVERRVMDSSCQQGYEKSGKKAKQLKSVWPERTIVRLFSHILLLSDIPGY